VSAADRRPGPVIAVVGAGIAGLAAAWELATASNGLPGSPALTVVVLDADPRAGGQLAAAEFAGRTIDLAADAFLARRPEATELCQELGIADQLVPVGASGASVLARGRLRPMPAGLALGVPTRWRPLVGSGLLSPVEALRVARDLVMPHLSTGAIGDRSVADIVGERLGRPVVERLVDPLIGGINAGGVDDLSAAATFPALIAASHQTGSLMRALRRLPAPDSQGPVFWSLRHGTASLADRLVDRLVDPGSGWQVSIRTGVSVDALTRVPGSGSGSAAAPHQWALTLGGNGRTQAIRAAEDDLLVDGVVLAVPAPRAAVLLAPLAPVAAGLLSTVEYASVGVVTLAIPIDAIGAGLDGTGFLVPRTSVIDGRPALMTGCTYLSRKWPHLANAGDELIRVSVGRDGDERYLELDDAELSAAAFAELARVLEIRGGPADTRVTRWPGAFPQYRVGHLIRVAQIEEAVSDLPGLAVAGAAYRGVGIPACIGSGRNAARAVLASMAATVG
jgi:oxygen-dependent protoporphyrinogen oxidase